jgi:hypothetical protein
MPIKKRARIAPTDDRQQLALLVEDPEQRVYEVMRTCVLFGQSPAERARQTGVPARSLYRMVERFDRLGMASLFVPIAEAPRSSGRSVGARGGTSIATAMCAIGTGACMPSAASSVRPPPCGSAARR